MKKKYLLLCFFLLAHSGRAFSLCAGPFFDVAPEASDFAGEVFNITSKLSTKPVVSLSVTKMGNRGNGVVSAIIDESSNLEGLRVDFKLNGEENAVMALDFDELERGMLLYYGEKEKTSPLIVKKVPGKKISKTLGGEFVFLILTKKPSTYKSYTINLTKSGGKWVARDTNGKEIKNIDLNPNLQGLFPPSWDGTFSEVKYSY